VPSFDYIPSLPLSQKSTFEATTLQRDHIFTHN